MTNKAKLGHKLLKTSNCEFKTFFFTYESAATDYPYH